MKSMTITIYGIKNCNTMKKAFDWLYDHNIAYEFHDYKKQAPDKNVLEQAFKAFGWENVINRKGMTWRALPDSVKISMNEKSAMDIAIEKPSIIKRPIVKADNTILLGFDENAYQDKFL